MDSRLANIELALSHLIKGFQVMNVNVQNVVTEVASVVAAVGVAVSKVNDLTSQVADLNTKLAAAVANSFDQSDVDALTKVVADLTAAVNSLPH